jgi:hypothetical protein
MKVAKVSWTLLFWILASGIGYLRGYSVCKAKADSGANLEQVEFLVPEQSFSEIANAKALLNGLCLRFLEEAQVARTMYASKSPGEAARPKEQSSLQLTNIIELLENARCDFEGTPQEIRLVQQMLLVLNEIGLKERWLELYLCTLYKHPTDDVVAHLAPDAIRIAVALGKQKEVIQALRHVVQIPFDFKSKQRLEELLAQNSTVDHLARSDLGRGRSPQ